MSRERQVYIIRNSRLDPDWAAVEPKTFSIAGRSISALIHSQGVGDLDRMFMTARRDKMDFNLAHIPQDFDLVPKEPFDHEYMRKLFDLGFELAKRVTLGRKRLQGTSRRSYRRVPGRRRGRG